MNAVEVRGVSVRYSRDVEAIRNVSFSLAAGSFLGVIGPNGGGKTTLLKAILSLVPLESGTIEVNVKPVSYVPQYATMSHEFPITVEEVVASALEAGSLRAFRKTRKREATPFLEEVGLAHLSRRLVGELSGGEFQRMLIARSLAARPALLLLDEPTANVDASSRKEVKKLLERLHERGMTIILVTHAIHGIRALVDRVVSIDGTLTEVVGNGNL